MQVFYSGVVWLLLTSVLAPVSSSDSEDARMDDGAIGKEISVSNTNKDAISHLVFSNDGTIAYELDDCQNDPVAILLLDLRNYLDNSPAVALNFATPLPDAWIRTIQSPDLFLLKVPKGRHILQVKEPADQGGQLLKEIELNISGEVRGEQLACQDTIHVSLDRNCQKIIGTDDLLEGNLRCLEDTDFNIEVLDEEVSNKNIVDGVGTHIFKISLKEDISVRGPNRWLSADRWESSGQPVVANGQELEINSQAGALSLPFAGRLGFKAASKSKYLLEWIDREGNSLGKAEVTAGQDLPVDLSFEQPFILTIRSAEDPASALLLSELEYHPLDLDTQLGFSPCAGYIKAEDKSAPQIDCQAEIASGTFAKSLQFLDGQLAEAGGTIDIKSPLCKEWPSEVLPGLHYFDTTGFMVNQTGWYSFELDADWGQGFGALYEKNFDSDQPCDHVIATAVYPSDALGYFGKPNTARIYAYLKPGKSYFLMTTSTSASQLGSYTWISFAEGASFIIGFDRVEGEVRFPLFCGDVDQFLNKPESLDWLDGIRSLTDCSDTRISLLDELLTSERCDPVIIKRQIEAKDEWGNSSRCEQQILFSQVGDDHLLAPLHKVYLSCDELIVKDQNGNPHPSMTGYPGLLSPFGIRNLRLQECNWQVTYFDERQAGYCAEETRILRSWQILNWCNPEEVVSFEQELIIGDFEGPTFAVELPEPRFQGVGQDTFVVSIGPFDCSTTFPIPAPVNIEDNCSDDIDKKAILLKPEGDTVALKEIIGAEIYFESIELGEYRLRYQVSDACQNTTEKELVLFVEDLIAPVAVCDDGFNVSIGGDGIGWVSAFEVDEGSWDACSEDVMLQVRRVVPEACRAEYEALTETTLLLDTMSGLYFSPWAERLAFICCDILKEVRVELLVIDKAGNTDYCWQEVLVEDKIPPVCKAPPSDTIDCTEYLVSDIMDSIQLQELFGVPKVLEEHCPTQWVEFPAVWEDYDCNEGKLTRKFMAIDASGNRSDTCYQYILVEKVHNYEIKFPKDVYNYKCAEILEDTMQLDVLGCDVLAIRKDTLIYAPDGGDGCGEWRIVHQVINWCEVTGNPVPLTISRNEDGDDLMGEEEVYVLVRPDGTAYIDDNNDESDGFIREVTSTGYWEYTQVIEILDTIQPLIIPDSHEPFCTYTDDCIGRVNFFFTTFDLCSRNNITIRAYYDENDDGDDEPLDDDQVRGRVPKFRLTGDYPVGDHSFRVEIIDGCGNKIVQRFPFSVIDCKAPAPVCVQQLAVELMPVFPAEDVDGDGDEDTGMNVVWVSDFKPSNAFEDCHPEIRYSIHRADEIAHPDSTHLVVTCDDPDVLEVRIYAWDNAYNPWRIQPDSSLGGPNYDYCTAFIDIQDNRFNLCDGDITVNSIAGRINTEQGAPMEGVFVQLSGASERTTLTNEEGAFLINQVKTGYDYTLSPESNLNPMDGVTTFDLVLMSKHILGIQAFDSPYQAIAADINNSGSVSSLDLIQMRKMILNLSTDFPNNQSWRFIDAAYSFENDPSQWLESFPEWININNFDPFSEESYDFVAIKTGDINFSNSIAKKNQPADVRNASQEISLYYQVHQSNNRIISLDIGSEPLEDLEGMQFTLAFDPQRLALSSVNTSASLLSEENMGFTFMEEGLLTVSWHEVSPKRRDSALPLLRLEFEQLDEAAAGIPLLEINSRLIEAEAYDISGTIRPLILKPADHSPTDFLLAGATPNPFRSQTDISFYLPQREKLLLEVVDYSGRRVLQREGLFDKGWQRIPIQNNELGSSGLYFYTIKTRQGTRSGKIVLLD
jgi:hypothetical protein